MTCRLLFILPVALWLAGCTSQPERHVRVLMRTTAGDITLELSDRTPKHRDNFEKLVREGVFDSLLFHRIISGFMIQAGDPTSKGEVPRNRQLGDADYGETLEAEIRFPELYHRRGVLAAARMPDEENPERRSSGSQFYIVWGGPCTDERLDAAQGYIDRMTGGQVVLPDSLREIYRTVGGTPHLDGQYTVFGRVADGLEVVERIQAMATDSLDRPLKDVRILEMQLIR